MSSIYESDALVEQYLLFHYGEADEILPYDFGPREALNFPVRIVTRWAARPAGTAPRALDLGCAVGRSSFELSKICSEVIGIDNSVRFIQAAEAIRSEGSLSYRRSEEAPNSTGLSARLPQGSRPERIKFITADALALPADLGQFDIVLAANLIDRVPDPQVLLRGLKSVVAPGGDLIITSPYTWLEEFTPKSAWLSSIAPAGRKTVEVIGQLLAPEFRLADYGDQPFLIREHARKFQWSVAQVSVWRRQ